MLDEDGYTPGLRIVLELARKSAAKMRHEEIAPEHYLLAILNRGGGMASQVFADLEVDTQRLRGAVERAMEKGCAGGGLSPTSGKAARRILDEATAIARELGCNWTSTEHLLLALLLAKESSACRLIEESGLTFENVKALASAFYERRFPNAEELKKMLEEQGVDWNDRRSLESRCGFGDLPGRGENSENK